MNTIVQVVSDPVPLWPKREEMTAKSVRRVRNLCRSFVSGMGGSVSEGRDCIPTFVGGLKLEVGKSFHC